MSYLYLAVAIWSALIFTVSGSNWESRVFAALPAALFFLVFGGLAIKSFGLF